MGQIYRLTDYSLLPALAGLRAEVWADSDYYQKDYLINHDWLDDHDWHADHWVVYEEGILVASARLCIHESFLEIPDLHLFPPGFGGGWKRDLPVASLNRLVVRKASQGRGLGESLDRERVLWARARGAKSAVICPVARRTAKLETLGFECVADARPQRGILRAVNEKCMRLRFLSGEEAKKERNYSIPFQDFSVKYPLPNQTP